MATFGYDTLVNQTQNITSVQASPVQYGLAQVKFNTGNANAVTGAPVRVVLRDASNSQSVEYDSTTNIAFTGTSSNSGKIQLTGLSSSSGFSATAGALGKAVYVDFASEYTDGWYTIASVEDGTTVTLNDESGNATTHTSSASGTTYLGFANDVSTVQGNLVVDSLPGQATAESVASIYAILLQKQAGGTHISGNYNLLVFSVADGDLGSPTTLGSAATHVSIRADLSLTVKDVDGNTVSDGGAVYVYPAKDSQRSADLAGNAATGWTVAQVNITFGEAIASDNYHLFVTEPDSDGSTDIVAQDAVTLQSGSTAGDADAVYETALYIPASLSASARDEAVTVQITVVDDVGRASTQSISLRTMQNPTFSVLSSGYGDTMHGGYEAFDKLGAGVEMIAIRVAVSNTVAISGAGTFASSNGSYVVAPSFVGAITDNGSGKVRLTFTDAGVARHIQANDYLTLGSGSVGSHDGDTGLVASVDAANNRCDLDIDYVADENSTATFQVLTSSVAGAMIAINGATAASNSGRMVPLATTELTYTENGRSFDVAGMAVVGGAYVYNALVAGDFTVTLNNPASGSYTTSAPNMHVTQTNLPTATLTWTATKGLGNVSVSAVDFTGVNRLEYPGAGTVGSSDAMLEATIGSAIDATLGATGITLTFTADSGSNFSTYFSTVTVEKTRKFEQTFTVNTANAPSDAVASIADVTSGNAAAFSVTNLNVWQTFTATSSLQTVAHMLYTTAADVDLITLRDTLIGGGYWTTYDNAGTGPALAGTAAASLSVVAADHTLATGAEGAIPSTPTLGTITSITETDLFATNNSALSLDDYSVYWYRVPSMSGITATSIQSLNTQASPNEALVDQSQVYTISNMPYVGGHTGVTGHSRMTDITNVVYDSATQLTVTVGSTTGLSSSDTVDISLAHANYNGEFTVSSVTDSTTVVLTGSGLSDAGSVTTGQLALQASGYYIPAPSVAFDAWSDNDGDDDQGGNFTITHWVNNGDGTCTMSFVLADTAASTYSGKDFPCTFTIPAFTPSTAKDGAVGTQTAELWAAQTASTTISFSNPAWNLGSVSDTILINYEPAGSETATYTDQADDSAHMELLDLSNAAPVTGGSAGVSVTGLSFTSIATGLILVSTSSFGSGDVNTAANVTMSTDVSSAIGIQWGLAQDSVAFTAADNGGGSSKVRITLDSAANVVAGDTLSIAGHDELTASTYTVDSVASLATANPVVTLTATTTVTDTTGTLTWILRPRGRKITNSGSSNASDEWNNGDELRIILNTSGTLPSNGDKFLVLLVDTAQNTYSSPRIADSFIRKLEVFWRGGLDAFALAQDDAYSFPGAVSFNVSSLSVVDQAGAAVASNAPAAFHYDMQLRARPASSAPALDSTGSNFPFIIVSAANGVDLTLTQLEEKLTYLPEVWNSSGVNYIDAKSTHNSRLNYAAADVLPWQYCLLVKISNSDADGVELNSAEGGDYYPVGFSTDQTGSVTIMQGASPYIRQVTTYDHQHLVVAGMEVHSAQSGGTTRSGPSTAPQRWMLGFTNVVSRLDVVSDDDIISGSA